MNEAVSEEKRATFKSMTEGEPEDFINIVVNGAQYSEGLVGRIMDHMRLLDGDFGGFPIDRLSHCLQAGTRAYHDGQSSQYIVMALLHDIGDSLATRNHGDLAAAIIKPYVSDRIHWIVEQHPVFQAYYFFHHLGMDRNMRDQHKDHEWFNDCVEFCAKYDQNCFDKDYENKSLEFFEPVMQEVFAKPLPGKCIYIPD
jgi:predicted HD phosphohydrolase